MTNWALWGTIVNTVLVLIGSLVGVGIGKLCHRVGKNRSEGRASGGITDSVMRAMGLCVILIGISGALKMNNVLVVIVSMAIGTFLGELIDLDAMVGRLGAAIERRFKRKDGGIAEGFVTATLLFCVGAMTVTGAIESGISHVHTTYYAKGLIDMVSATVFATTLGVGVALSAVSVFVVQAAFTLLAVLAGGAIPVAVTGEMIAVGSLLVVAIGTNLLGVTRIKVMNMLPAMFLPIALVPLFSLLPL
ncbi:MAG: DUF554 domain-containing protein [Ruminococcaceae bacterium]|nr:DUF554 domain-containing protein [Oscillospiraceae bacterium]